MACEQINIDGQLLTTLKELLRPGLRAVIVGINPGCKSVSLGHYWQGMHGKLMWSLLTKYKVLHDLRPGQEDEDAFAQDIGMTDLIREPSRSAAQISNKRLHAAVPDLVSRLSAVDSVPIPIIVRYKSLANVVGQQLRDAGHEVLRIPSTPGKYSDSPAEREILMEAILRTVGTTGR